MKKIGCAPAFEVSFKEEPAEAVGRRFLQNIIGDADIDTVLGNMDVAEYFEESDLRGILTPELSYEDASEILSQTKEDGGSFILADPERGFEIIYKVARSRDEEGYERVTFYPMAHPINWYGAGDFDFGQVTFVRKHAVAGEPQPPFERIVRYAA